MQRSVSDDSVSKLLANPVFEANSPKKETSEVITPQRFSIGGGGVIFDYLEAPQSLVAYADAAKMKRA